MPVVARREMSPVPVTVVTMDGPSGSDGTYGEFTGQSARALVRCLSESLELFPWHRAYIVWTLLYTKVSIII